MRRVLAGSQRSCALCEFLLMRVPAARWCLSSSQQYSLGLLLAPGEGRHLHLLRCTPPNVHRPVLPLCRSLTDLFAADPECAAKGKADRQAGGAGLARSMQFAGARLDDELELKKLQVRAGLPSDTLMWGRLGVHPTLFNGKKVAWLQSGEIAAGRGGGLTALHELVRWCHAAFRQAAALASRLPTVAFLQVFVRIRPSVTAGAPAPRTVTAADAARENCVHATSRHSIAIAPPEGSQAYKSGDRGQTYSFSRVFDRDTPQEEYYEATAAPLVSGAVC